MGGFGSDFGSDFGFEQGVSTPASSGGVSVPSINRLMRTPIVDVQTGRLTADWMRYLRYNHQRVSGSLDLQGILNAPAADFSRAYTNKHLDNIPDGSTYKRPLATALTNGQVDLSKTGVIGPLGSVKISQNVMNNYSNNATVDSVDNGTNATIRVYGQAGGPGTTWHQFIGSLTSAEYPAFSGAFNYNTDYNVWYDGAAWHVSTQAFPSLADGIIFAGSLHTVSAGGTGGSSGGGGTGGGSGGGQRK